MEVRAIAKNLKISPKKARLVVDLVRGKTVNEAINQLLFLNKKAAGFVLKLINSAVANAEHNFNLDKNNLYIKVIKVDQGIMLKRWKPRAFGRAAPIRRRRSHITVVLDELKVNENNLDKEKNNKVKK